MTGAYFLYISLHRMLCAANLAGIRIFPKAGTHIFTGCTRHPGPKSRFGPEHEKEESPSCRHVDKLSKLGIPDLDTNSNVPTNFK